MESLVVPCKHIASGTSALQWLTNQVQCSVTTALMAWILVHIMYIAPFSYTRLYPKHWILQIQSATTWPTSGWCPTAFLWELTWTTVVVSFTQTCAGMIGTIVVQWLVQCYKNWNNSGASFSSYNGTCLRNVHIYVRRSDYNDCYHNQSSLGHTADN